MTTITIMTSQISDVMNTENFLFSYLSISICADQTSSSSAKAASIACLALSD